MSTLLRTFKIFLALCMFTSYFQAIRCHCKRGNSCRLVDDFVKVRRHNCQVRRIPVRTCRGCCLSYTINVERASLGNPLFVSKSDCCRVTESEEVHETIRCSGGQEDVVVRSATRCLCTECGNS